MLMTTFFFYKYFTLPEHIQKLSLHFEMADGYAIVESYTDGVLHLNDEPQKNNSIVHGKIVHFPFLKVNDVVTKINEIDECKSGNQTKYSMKMIWVSKSTGGMQKAYIIY